MNNRKRRWKLRLLFALRTLILIKIFLVASPVVGQSRLGAIRKEVRNQPAVENENQSERKRPSSSEKRQEPDRASDRHNHDREKGRRNHSPRRRSNRNRRFDFFAYSVPQQVIHTREIHVIEPQPVFRSQFAQPVVAQPVETQPTLLDEHYETVVEHHEPILLDEPFVGDVFVSEFENWGARITGWYGGGIDDISQGNLGILFQAPHAIGLDGNVRTIREKGFSDHLWLGDLNLVYEPICNEYFRLRVGAGFNWLADSWGSDFGFNLTSGFDAKLTNRLFLGGELDLGNLGHSDYLHAQLNLGYRIDNVELVVGYDHTNIGDINLDSPFAGLRFRF